MKLLIGVIFITSFTTVGFAQSDVEKPIQLDNFRLSGTFATKKSLDSIVVSDVQGIIASKTKYSYDAEGKLSFSIIDYLQWNPARSDRNEYIYDSVGNVVTEIRYHWDHQSFLWIPSIKYEYTYDLSNNKTLSMSFEYNSSLGQYTNVDKSEFIYDDHNNCVRTLWYRWRYEQWDLSNRTEMTFDQGGNRTVVVYDPQNPVSKTVYTYDLIGNNTIRIQYKWNSSSDEWIPYVKAENDFNDEQYIKTSIRYDWNSSLNQWVGSSKTEYAFDDSGNPIRYIDFTYFSGEWIYYSKEEYTYNNIYPAADLISPLISFFPTIFKHKHMLIQEKSYSYNGRYGWNLGSISDYYYSDWFATSVPEYSNDRFVRIFPNPCKDYITFRSNENFGDLYLELYNVYGVLILNQMITNDVPVSVQNLAKGLYLFRISGSGRTFSGKVILR